MENVNTPMMDNEITTADFSAIFDNGGVFADEQKPDAGNVNELEGLSFKDDWGNEIDADNLYETDFLNDDTDDTNSAIDDMINQTSTLGNVVSVNGVTYQKEEVEKALSMHNDVKSLADNLNSHMQELEDYEMNMNELYSISRSEIDEYIQHYQSVLDNERVDPATRTEAYKEIRRYEGQKAQMEMQYKKTFEANQAAKQRAERLKGQAIANQLKSMNWKEKDFSQVAGFMSSNNISIPFESASAEMMIAMRKAAMFDEAQNKNKEEISNSVQRALAGKPARTSKNISPEDERRKARAAAMASKGELSANDMFSFLKD